MGEPYHLALRRPGLEHGIWKSLNYALYGDMSRRMYQVLTALAPQVEPYSIDEMFLDFRRVPDPPFLASGIRAAVQKATKIPICVGGPTKNIGKLANAIAKKDICGNGVCDLRGAEVRACLYRDLPVGSVWGIGPAATAKLNAIGATTIAEFIALPDDTIRHVLAVVGLRTCWELRGISCLPVSLAPSTANLSP
jgi:DNA polymerase V